MGYRAVNSESYEAVEARCQSEFGCSFLEALVDSLLVRRLSVSATARRLGVERAKLYKYAEANGLKINVRSEVRLVDVTSAQLERDIAQAAEYPAGSDMAEWAEMARETLTRRQQLLGRGAYAATGTDG